MFKQIDLKNKTTKYILQVLLLLVGFFLDGLLKQFFAVFNLPSFQVSVQILLIVIVMMILRDQQVDSHLFWYTLILGIVYDSYYSHIFGLYTIVLPLVGWLTNKIRKFVPKTLVFEWCIYFISLTVSLIYLFLIGNFLSLITVDIAHFVTDWLGPTLLVNSIFFVILYYPLTKVLDWLM